VKILIPKDITVEKLEDLYSKINMHSSSIDIQLPSKIETNEFSLLPSLIQFISTWIRKENSGKLLLPIMEHEINDYLYNNDFAYPIIVMCWEKEIFNNNDQNIKKALKDPSKEYFQQMDFFNLKSSDVPIFCFDFDKSNRGIPKCLYINKETLFLEGALDFNLFPAYQKVGNFNKELFRKHFTKDFDAITGIIYELFLNTHEHAKTDVYGNYLYPNIRAIVLKFHKKRIETLKKNYENMKGLVSYFNSDFDLSSQDELYLLEISIIDSGPGLVKRYSGISNLNQLQSQDEVNYVKKCLYRHNTSSDISIRDTKGIGLDRMLRTIDKKGFLRIKTGRIDIIRDAKNNQYVHTDNPEKILLSDKKTNDNKEFTLYQEASGTLISIFYPLTFNV